MNGNNIKVSVIMPIYNAYDYLRPAMDSVLDQTLREIEVICIDDGSTDRSLEIIKEYQKSDERVRIVTENNAGPSIARNKGIVRARGEYMVFLDADDFYELDMLSRLYEAAKSNDLDIAVARFDIYNNKRSNFVPAIDEGHGDIFSGGAIASKNEYPDYILQSTTGYVWNKIFRTAFIKEKELLFAPELYVFEDVYFVCSALSLAERVGRIDNVLVHHRVYSDQSRAKLFRKYYAQVPIVYMRVKDFLMQKGMYVPLARSYLNLSANHCYKIYNLLWSDAKVQFWNLLHEGYADSFGWYRHESTDYESEEVYEFVANVGLYTHEQYLKRVDKGVTHTVRRLGSRLLNKKVKIAKSRMRKRDRFKRFLKRFFHIKDKPKAE